MQDLALQVQILHFGPDEFQRTPCWRDRLSFKRQGFQYGPFRAKVMGNTRTKEDWFDGSSE
jgi:hypothetical protein